MKKLLVLLLTLSAALPALAQSTRNVPLPGDVTAPITRVRPLQGTYRPVVVNGFVKYQDYLGNLIDPAMLFNIVSTTVGSGTSTGGITQSFADNRYRQLSTPINYQTDLNNKPTSLSAFTNDPAYQTAGQVNTAIGTATTPLSQSINQNATDIAGKLSTSTYTTNRSADQAATTSAQNTANTALTTANSATATAAGKVDKTTTITVNGVSQPLSGPVSFSISGTNSTTLTQVSQLSNDAGYQNGSQVGAAISSTVNSITSAQQTTDNNQTLSISQKLSTTIFNSFSNAQATTDQAQSTSISQNSADIGNRLLTSTYTANRATDQAATTSAQNTANTALTTANSGTATGASNSLAITALQNAGYQTATQVVTAVSSGTASAAASQTAIDAAQNTQIATRLPGSFSATQASRDAAQDTDISGRLLSSTYATNRTADQNATAAAQTTANSATVTAANNTTAIAGKQPTITSGSSLTAGSLVVNTPTDSDSTGTVPTTNWVRRYVLRTIPTFIDFPYNRNQFTFGDSLNIRPDYIRGLFSATGTGSSYNATTGVFSFTGGSGGTSGPWSTSGTATYYNAGPVGIGTNAPRKLFDVNGTAVFTSIYVRGQNDAETDANVLENAPGAGIRIRGGYIHSFNTIRHEGNGNFFTDGNYFLRGLGRDDRAIFINSGGITIGNGTNTANATVDITGTQRVTSNATFGASVTVTGPLSVSSVKFLDGTTLTTAPLASTATTTTRPGSVSAIVSTWNSATANATVHIQSGTYNMTGTTLIIAGKNNVTLRADKDVTLYNTDGGTILLSNGNNTNVTIDGLTLTTSFTQAAGTPDLSTSLLYTNEQGTNTGVEVKNCKFSAPNCRMNLVTTSAYSSRKSGGNGQGKLQTNLSYHDNEFGPGGRMGIELTSHTNEDSLYTTIYMRNLSITKNYFHDLGLLARPDGVKNGMGPSVSGPIEFGEISNNRLVDCNLLGIETAGARRFNITDNVIDYVNQTFTGISVSDNTTRFDARDINIVGNQIRSKTKGINMYRVAETNATGNQVKVDQDTGDGGTVYIQECLGVTLTGGSVQGRANNTIRVDNSNQVQIGGGIRLKNDRVTFSLVSIFGTSAAPSTWVAVDADCMFIKSNGPSASGVVETIGTTSNITGVR